MPAASAIGRQGLPATAGAVVFTETADSKVDENIIQETKRTRAGLKLKFRWRGDQEDARGYSPQRIWEVLGYSRVGLPPGAWFNAVVILCYLLCRQ